jgi:hypothetical protein
MAAVREIHSQISVPWLKHGEEYGHIRLSARMRLNVDVIAFEKSFRPATGQIFNYIDVLAASVVSSAGIAFCILIGKNAALGLHHRSGCEVFRRNEFESMLLAFLFVRYDFEDLRICLFQRGHHFSLCVGQHGLCLKSRIGVEAIFLQCAGIIMIPSASQVYQASGRGLQ